MLCGSLGELSGHFIVSEELGFVVCTFPVLRPGSDIQIPRSSALQAGRITMSTNVVTVGSIQNLALIQHWYMPCSRNDIDVREH